MNLPRLYSLFEAIEAGTETSENLISMLRQDYMYKDFSEFAKFVWDHNSSLETLSYELNIQICIYEGNDFKEIKKNPGECCFVINVEIVKGGVFIMKHKNHEVISMESFNLAFGRGSDFDELKNINNFIGTYLEVLKYGDSDKIDNFKECLKEIGNELEVFRTFDNGFL
jgi:hypothetical protein